MSPVTVQFDHLVAGSESYQIGSDRIVFSSSMNRPSLLLTGAPCLDRCNSMLKCTTEQVPHVDY